MTDRSYTVAEIDDLRHACEMRWLFGTSKPDFSGGRISRQYKSEEKSKAVEEIVRTHMLAGHTAKDIYDNDDIA